MLNRGSARSLEAATGAHDNGFNLVRLIAALAVVVFHAWQLNRLAPMPDPLSRMMAPVTDLGNVAVGVFFLISGIFVSKSWLRDPHLLRFTLRRVVRIVPALFICLLLTTTLALAFHSVQGLAGLFDGATWRYILGNASLHGLRYIIPPNELTIPGVLEGRPLNGSLWTLYWEARMYIVLGLLGVAAIAPMRWWLMSMSVVLLLSTQLFPSVLSGYIWEVPMWSLFLTGVLLQTLSRHLRFGFAPVAVAAILLALNWTRNQALTPSGLTLVGIYLAAGALALWLGSARPRGLAHIQKHDYSYSIYIYHWPVMSMLAASLPPSVGAKTLLGLTVALTFLCAACSWHCVEAPAMRLLRRKLARHGGETSLRAAA
ncbi:acyltransferase family protein [Pseudoduganella violacea]|uniref:Peptidoglycan/LPS O-acetylase OafA/YrhL n=1 Tax=Pseudoduganella violacea TaxID=1715466 RepID=A0A7W5FTR7_9BURK|nr:acyltransferase [Pseudoduganella violacea]MBB3119135.1 peptidoglycan/LPS O-acetylase OafA/YrhL [Pseudoduganella violacea]